MKPSKNTLEAFFQLKHLLKLNDITSACAYRSIREIRNASPSLPKVFSLKASTWKMWVMKPPSRALRKLFRFKILSLGELLWVWQEAHPTIPGDFQVSWRVSTVSMSQLLHRLSAFTDSFTSWLSGRGQVDAYSFIHSFIPLIHSNWFTECQFYTGTIPEV